MKLPHQVSESVRRRNPEIYGALGRVDTVIRKPDSPAALVEGGRTQQARKSRLEIIATIIVFRRRLCDDDNSQSGGTKALRDAIAESLGYDDGDKRIRFQYGQAHTTGQQGCLVRIETV